MFVKEVGHLTGIFANLEQNGIIFKPNRAKDSDGVIAEINGKFEKDDDIVVPNTIELTGDDQQAYDIDSIDVVEVHLIKVERTSPICIQIPENVKDIWIEEECKSCKLGFVVAEGNENFYSESFSLYNKKKTEMIRCYSENHEDIKLPESIMSIRKGAFTGLWINKLTIPEGFGHELSFRDLNAEFITEVDCKGLVRRIIGTPDDSTPMILRINNTMSEIQWEGYQLYNSRKQIRNIITRKPKINGTMVDKKIIRLHGFPEHAPELAEAMKYHFDCIPLIIAISSETGDIDTYEKNGNLHFDLGSNWIMAAKEKFFDTYDGNHKGAVITFIDKEGKNRAREYPVFENVDEVAHLVKAALL